MFLAGSEPLLNFLFGTVARFTEKEHVVCHMLLTGKYFKLSFNLLILSFCLWER